MNSKEQPRLKRDWIGRNVRTLRVIATSIVEIPAGTVMEVVGNHGGLDLKAPACPGCGIRPFVRKVAAYDVVLLAKEVAEDQTHQSA